jgi:hypothetical protein
MADALLQRAATVVEPSHDLESLRFTYYALKDGILGNPPWPHAFAYTDLQTLQARQEWFTANVSDAALPLELLHPTSLTLGALYQEGSGPLILSNAE